LRQLFQNNEQKPRGNTVGAIVENRSPPGELVVDAMGARGHLVIVQDATSEEAEVLMEKYGYI
jgi:hypothetical protein